VADGRVVQRHVLYLGEINDAQRAAWCRSIAVFDEDAGAATQLALFPEDRQLDTRIEAHSFVAFLAYCLQVTQKAPLRPLAPGLTPRSALEKFAAIQMVDVHLPTTDGRTLILSRYTEPEPDQRLLLDRLNLQLPAQPPPRITAALQASIH